MTLFVLEPKTRKGKASQDKTRQDMTNQDPKTGHTQNTTTKAKATIDKHKDKRKDKHTKTHRKAKIRLEKEGQID